MSKQMKTPGVYLNAPNAYTVVEAPTAIPAFIGYTEKAGRYHEFLNMPVKIQSFDEFRTLFGGSPEYTFDITLENENVKEIINKTNFHFYNQINLFFKNGGGVCYIVSIGDYNGEIQKDHINYALDVLKRVDGPTLILAPEAAFLPAEELNAINRNILAHCSTMKCRFGILDTVKSINKDLLDDRRLDANVISDFRDGIGNTALNFGAAYYPWLKTDIIDNNILRFINIAINDNDEKVGLYDYIIGDVQLQKNYASVLTEIQHRDIDEATIHKTLYNKLPLYKHIFTRLEEELNILPPSSAIAGIYTNVDTNMGVWKSPANVSLNSVVSPLITITNVDLEDLNLPPNGKAINAIRSFKNDGIKIWGARTLDGNSSDWRYISIKRTMMMIQSTLENICVAHKSEANDAKTWGTMKSVVNNYLRNLWKHGGLAGTVPEDAYNVCVGLGETMTPNDVLDGILRVEVLVALVRPGEFIEITFEQQMQKAN